MTPKMQRHTTPQDGRTGEGTALQKPGSLRWMIGGRGLRIGGSLALVSLLALSPLGTHSVFASCLSLGSYDTATGTGALANECGGYRNTADGHEALFYNTKGSNNTAVGVQAGVSAAYRNANVSGADDTFLGANTGPGTTTQLSNATAVGANAIVSESNALVLGGLGPNAVKVGIGTSSPTSTLTVAGTIRSTSGGVEFPDGSVQTTSAITARAGSAGTYLRSTGTAWTASRIQAADLPGLDAGKIATGTLPVARGGTGLSSSGAAGSFLRSNGSGWTASGIRAGDVPAGSDFYLQNTASQQAHASFNIDGSGTLGGTLSVGRDAGVGVSGSPHSLLQVGSPSDHYGSYLQVPVVTSRSRPPASDCNTSTFVGRLVLRHDPSGPPIGPTTMLWSCSVSGKWVVLGASGD